MLCHFYKLITEAINLSSEPRISHCFILSSCFVLQWGFLQQQRGWSNKLLTRLMIHPHTREKRSTGVSGKTWQLLADGSKDQVGMGKSLEGADDGKGKGTPGHRWGGRRRISRLCCRKERKDPGEKGNPGESISRLCSAGMSNAPVLLRHWTYSHPLAIKPTVSSGHITPAGVSSALVITLNLPIA